MTKINIATFVCTINIIFLQIILYHLSRVNRRYAVLRHIQTNTTFAHYSKNANNFVITI